MSEKRIVVPEGMLRAAIDASGITNHVTITEAVEAALDWQSENPQVPTDEQCDELINMIGANGRSLVRYPSRISKEQARNMLVEWQRRMYLSPEPTVQFFDTAFGRFEIDNRVPPGEIRLHNWNGPTLVKNIGTLKKDSSNQKWSTSACIKPSGADRSQN